MKPTHAEVAGLLSYCPESGVLRWRTSSGNQVREGADAGTLHPDGYRIVRIARRGYPAHRLAWLLVTGEWPLQQVDHRNGVRSDNRLSNLRQASPGENNQNLHGPLSSNRTSRFLGVCWKRREERWRAQIQVNGVRRDLGLFATEEEAHRAYSAAKAELHPFHHVAA
ncbi:HNH endonuclease [Stenotrophomonas nitritireducens]|uniref:AP2/ERF domain-containing protein n=1 Tax=Stenotrophomonas nitritireducens TaxID=83617 RepID=A0ABR5NFP9_9GAMM|nr:hypothetical protein ABB22_16920 [Stenotrophomonas nitritireducens]